MMSQTKAKRSKALMMIKNLHKLNSKQLTNHFAKIPWELYGKILDIVGTVIEASVPEALLGTVCEIERKNSKQALLCQVVGFKGQKTLLLPFSEMSGIGPGNLIRKKGLHDDIDVGPKLLGRVLNAFLNPLDGNDLNIKVNASKRKIDLPPPNPLSRQRIKKQLPYLKQGGFCCF